ncbi:MAG: cadherin-like domain-containing protein [Planctomycetales bacterium]|nr:cadherin-like domain-containing protein [Planctomycetales bacterium]
MDFVNGAFTRAEVEIDLASHAFTDQSRIRFVSDASNNRDDVYLDEILIEGFGPPPPPPVNHNPVATNDAATTVRDQPVTIAALANDADEDGDTLAVDSFTQPANGSVVLTGPGLLTYSPSPGFVGVDQFTYVVIDGAGGADTGTVTVQVSEPSVWTDLVFEDFENGFGQFADGGRDATLYSRGAHAHQGTSAANLQDGNGADSSIELANPLDLQSPGYSTLRVEFWFKTVGFESGDSFELQYFDGSSWQTIEAWIAGADFVDSSFVFASVEISAANYAFSAQSGIRLMSTANSKNDDVYLDEILISAK